MGRGVCRGGGDVGRIDVGGVVGIIAAGCVAGDIGVFIEATGTDVGYGIETVPPPPETVPDVVPPVRYTGPRQFVWTEHCVQSNVIVPTVSPVAVP
jgi:hypothetical protein